VVIIGVDPHKRQHTATAVEAAAQRVLGSVEIEADLPGYRRLLRWAQRYESRRWAVENAHGLGRHLAQWLVARGEAVCDVPSTATARGVWVRSADRGAASPAVTLGAGDLSEGLRSGHWLGCDGDLGCEAGWRSRWVRRWLLSGSGGAGWRRERGRACGRTGSGPGG